MNLSTPLAYKGFGLIFKQIKALEVFFMHIKALIECHKLNWPCVYKKMSVFRAGAWVDSLRVKNEIFLEPVGAWLSLSPGDIVVTTGNFC